MRHPTCKLRHHSDYQQRSYSFPPGTPWLRQWLTCKWNLQQLSAGTRYNCMPAPAYPIASVRAQKVKLLAKCCAMPHSVQHIIAKQALCISCSAGQLDRCHHTKHCRPVYHCTQSLCFASTCQPLTAALCCPVSLSDL